MLDSALTAKTGSAVYLAPGWSYRLENVGDEPAFFVYGMAPSPA
jgi:hypothetical protein